MKKGWQTKALGELCKIELGKTPARANASLWDEKRETGNVWLSIADLLKAENNIVVDSKEYISDKGAAICKLVPHGTLLVSFKLTLGRLAFAGCDLFTNEAIAALTIFNERELSKKFLFYCLAFFDWVKAAENDVKLKGMTLNKAKLKVIPVSFPPLAEQQRLVDLLDEAFENIDTAKANAEINLQNARALFESYLQSIFTQRGGGWMHKRLDEVCTFSSGGTPSKNNSSYWKGIIPWISGRDMKSTRLSDALLHISKAAVEESSTCMAAAGTLLVLVRGMGLAHGAQIAELTAPCAFNQDIKGIHADSSLIPRYLLFALRNCINSSATILSSAAHGTLKIDSNELRRVLIPIPPRECQQRIVKTIDALTEETQCLARLYEQKLAALEALKKSLLHDVFTGRLGDKAA